MCVFFPRLIGNLGKFSKFWMHPCYTMRRMRRGVCLWLVGCSATFCARERGQAYRGGAMRVAMRMCETVHYSTSGLFPPRSGSSGDDFLFCYILRRMCGARANCSPEALRIHRSVSERLFFSFVSGGVVLGGTNKGRAGTKIDHFPPPRRHGMPCVIIAGVVGFPPAFGRIAYPPYVICVLPPPCFSGNLIPLYVMFLALRTYLCRRPSPLMFCGRFAWLEIRSVQKFGGGVNVHLVRLV